MDKLLAMSILSSTPAEIAGFWKTTMKIRKGTEPEKDGRKSGSCRQGEQNPAMKEPRQQPRGKAWFAPEFDGINCFETLVSY